MSDIENIIYLIQQSPLDEQVAPLAWQEDDAHDPETQSLLQQSLLDAQLAPIAAHVGWAQAPLVLRARKAQLQAMASQRPRDKAM